MEPAVKADSVFLFTQPEVGKAFGYTYDGWRGDGTFHYTGDGQEGDQSPDAGGNRALLQAPQQGRAIRVFRSEGPLTTYLGVFRLDDPPWFPADAPDRNGQVRKVLVFRLVPSEEVLRDAADVAPIDPTEAEELSIEALDVESYAASRPEESTIAVRREAQLVLDYCAWLAARGESTTRHRIPLPAGGFLYTDVFNKATSELIEAKASAARPYVRAGLGQLLDYARYLPHERRALLTPSRPADDLIDLLKSHNIGAIWQDGPVFDRVDP
jgi:hypothetical protein